MKFIFLGIEKNIIKIYFLASCSLLIFSLYTMGTGFFDLNHFSAECSSYVFPQIFDNVSFQKKDIYIFPEIKNILCLNKELANQESLTLIGTNPKFVNYLILFGSIFYFLTRKLLKNRIFLIGNFVFLIFIFINFYYSLNFFSFFIFLFFYFYYLLEHIETIQKSKIHSLFILKNPYLAITIFGVVVLLTQFSTHHYETLNWDINVFITASLDIGRGFLPYENHFENKPPLLFFIYFLISTFSNGSLLILKVINDLVLWFCAIILYLIFKEKNYDGPTTIFGPIFFIILMSSTDFHSGYSELYSVLMLGISYLILCRFTQNSTYLIAGIFFGLSTLVNLGSALYLLGYLVYIYTISKNRNSIFYFIIGFSVPHLIFILLYFFKDLLELYLNIMILAPLKYSGGDLDFFHELGVILVKVSGDSVFTFISIIFLITIYVYSLNKNKLNQNKMKISNYPDLVIIMTGLIIYFLNGKGYEHHLIFFAFFFPLIISFIQNKKTSLLLSIFIFISLFSTISIHATQSITNIRNFQNLEQNYPIKKISKELNIKSYESPSFFILDNTLFIYYLDAVSVEYISHPALLYEDGLMDILSKFELTDSNFLITNLNKKPDFIICSEKTYDCNNIDDYTSVSFSENLSNKYLHYYESEKQVIVLKRSDS
jgi:hypothetical protein